MSRVETWAMKVTLRSGAWFIVQVKSSQARLLEITGRVRAMPRVQEVERVSHCFTLPRPVSATRWEQLVQTQIELDRRR